jgi:serine/threonine protein kinase
VDTRYTAKTKKAIKVLKDAYKNENATTVNMSVENQEIFSLKNCTNEHILRYYEWFWEDERVGDSRLAIVTEYCEVNCLSKSI